MYTAPYVSPQSVAVTSGSCCVSVCHLYTGTRELPHRGIEGLQEMMLLEAVGAQ